MDAHHHHHPGHAHPPATVSPSILRLSVLERLAAVAVVVAVLWGAVVLGDGMSAALEFRNLTLGYDRHPAVHHLHGAVEHGALMAVVGPNGAGKSTLFKGIVGMLKPLAGGIDLCGARARDIAYLPQIAEIDRSFPIGVYDMVAMGLWREAGLFGGIGKREREKVRAAIVGGGPLGFRGAADRHAVGRADAARAVRAAAAAGCARDRARRAVQRDRHQDRGRLLRSGAALARARSAPCIAALHDLDLVKSMFPEALLLAREPVAWGATADVLTAENLLKARRMCEAFDEHAHECAA